MRHDFMLADACRDNVCSTFRTQFGEEDVLVRAPGRINLIGEHTDYNDGLAMPGAVDRSLWLALRRRADHQARISALSLQRFYEGSLSGDPTSDGRWPHYLLGIASELQRMGYPIGGFDLAYDSDIPNGSGLSSSMALACGLILGLGELFNLGLSREEVAHIAQASEQRYVGTRCGPMDPAAVLFGERNRVMLLDCRSRARMPIVFPASKLRIVLCDSRVERSAAKDRYNTHRDQCEAAVYMLRKHRSEIRSLRDVTHADIEAHADELGPHIARRASYVVAENERVLRACVAIERGDLAALGSLMAESHMGLRRDFEVSCREVDILVDAATSHPGVAGARIMGTGFGGCTINLVYTDALPDFTRYIERVYRERLQRAAYVYRCALGPGAQRIA